jgi:SPP1 gp7 family putative phage head morphogenesis protein
VTFDESKYEDQLDTLIKNSSGAAVHAYVPLLDALKSALHSASTFEEANKTLDHFKPQEGFLNPFSKHLQTSFETAESLGRSLILAKDAHLVGARGNVPTAIVRGTKNLNALSFDWFTCAQGVNVSFDVLPESAIKALYYRSLVVSGVEQVAVLQSIKDALARALAKHETYDEFKNEIDQIVEDSGVNIQRIQTIFRTNLASLYSEGELNQVREMGNAFPMWRYSAIRDRHTRPTHWDFNGTVWNIGDGPIPPIDYNCRCSAIYLYKSEAAGLQPEIYNPGDYIDPDTGDPVVRFDNRTSFGDSWAHQQADSLPPDIHSWINERLSDQ